MGRKWVRAVARIRHDKNIDRSEGEVALQGVADCYRPLQTLPGQRELFILDGE